MRSSSAAVSVWDDTSAEGLPATPTRWAPAASVVRASEPSAGRLAFFHRRGRAGAATLQGDAGAAPCWPRRRTSHRVSCTVVDDYWNQLSELTWSALYSSRAPSTQLTEKDLVGRCSIVPHYFFSIVDDDHTIVDTQGVELADLDEVHQEAVTSAREPISEGVLRGEAPNGRRFVVTDEAGAVVAEIPFKDTMEK